jgi:N-acyl amino acid synthase of PEP-CTERM/exosortase system
VPNLLADHHNQAALRFLRVEQGHLLEKIFELRYRVYCLGRGFLPPERYPSGIETDEFDQHSMHFAALDGFGRVVGTVRVVLDSKEGLPLDRHLPREGDLHLHGVPRRRLGEISRLAVQAPVSHSGAAEAHERLHRRPDVALGLYKEIYHASRKAGVSHLIAAMERPLARLLHRFAFPFHPIGPEIDYYGPVRPYLLDIAEWEHAVHARCPSTFARFIDGLPRSLQPTWFAGERTRDALGEAAFRDGDPNPIPKVR